MSSNGLSKRSERVPPRSALSGRLSRSLGRQDGPAILLAEDDMDMRNLLTWSLARQGYRVTECRDGRHLLDQLSVGPSVVSGRFDLIVTDLRMPELRGLEALRRLGKTAVNLPPVILITAFGDPSLHREAKRLGVTAILDKPFEIGDLLRTAARILKTRPQEKKRKAAEKVVLLEIESFVHADVSLVEPGSAIVDGGGQRVGDVIRSAPTDGGSDLLAVVRLAALAGPLHVDSVDSPSLVELPRE